MALHVRLPAALALLCLCGGALSQTRIRTRIDADWRFHLEKSAASSAVNIVGKWLWSPLPDQIDPSKGKLEQIKPSQPAWETAHSGDDVFHGRVGFALFETTLTAPMKPADLHFESVDDNATVFIDGKRAFSHEGWNDPFDVPLSVVPGASFTVDVIVENTGGPGGIGAVSFGTPESAAVPAEARDGFNDFGWRVVHLPHDYVIEGKFDPKFDPGHGALERGKAWYRRKVFLPESARNKVAWIEFDGAFSDAHVWWNGHFLGAHRSGYTGFRFDLGRWAKYGVDNEVAVHLDASKTEGWWYEGGGLYRHVWLTIADAVHIAPLGGVFVTSTVANPLVPRPRATVHVETALDNLSFLPNNVLIVHTLIRPDRTIAAKTSGSTFTTDLADPHAQLWSLEHPNLYTLKTEVYRSNQKIDEVSTTFGIRTIRFDSDHGFFLNERPVKLKGTCNHQDFIGVGIGMPDSVLEWRIRRLLAMGSNAYRCSHNEVASELLDACDRLGMLVMDENREFGDTFSGKANERTTTNDLSDFRQEILRDRNHPSVIMWSLGNEEFSVQTTPAGGRIGRVMTALAHLLDPSRPVTIANNSGHGHQLSAAMDIEGFNYGPWEYPVYHKAHPDQPIFASETASTVSDRGEYADDKVHGYVTGYDLEGANTAEDAWQPIAEEPYNEGGFVWTGFDYKGEPSPYGWPCISSHFGIMDSCGFPKDNYYYYKAWWGSQPIVHIEPHWNWAGKVGQPIDVWAFSNGDSVELILNGRSLGTKPMPKYRHVSWSVPYEPGVLEARSIVGGKIVAADMVSTTGSPYALKVSTTKHVLESDGEDCAMIEVSLLDREGRVVPTASNLVRFAVSGPAIAVGVGNGDPSSHEPDRASTRHAFNGRCMGIVQTVDGRHGAVQVTVSSPGLESAELTLQVK